MKRLNWWLVALVWIAQGLACPRPAGRIECRDRGPHASGSRHLQRHSDRQRAEQRDPRGGRSALCDRAPLWHPEFRAYDLWGLTTPKCAWPLTTASPTAWRSVSRATPTKTYEANVKARLLRQKTGPEAFPLSVTWYSVAMANGTRGSRGNTLSLHPQVELRPSGGRGAQNE